MSFEIHDHIENRIKTLRLLDFLTQTVGAAVVYAGDQFNVPTHTTHAVSRQVVNGLMAVVAGAKGARFNGYDAARVFFIGELQMAVADYLEDHRPHYDEHIDYDDAMWERLKAIAARETIAAINALLTPRRR